MTSPDYYQRNKEKCLAYSGAYYQRNKEHAADCYREWYKRNKDRKDATARAWRQRNKERMRLYYERNKKKRAPGKRALYERDKARIQAVNLAWARANKDRVVASNHAKRARRKSAPGRFTNADIERLRLKQQGICAAPHCNTPLTDSCTVDHKQPVSRGGSNWPRNLQLLCWSCNSSKGAKTMKEWLVALAEIA